MQATTVTGRHTCRAIIQLCGNHDVGTSNAVMRRWPPHGHRPALFGRDTLGLLLQSSREKLPS